MLVISRRRRTLLLTCGVVAAGGYVSYRLYKSAAFARRRYRVSLLCKSLWSILEVLSEGSDSASVVLKDLHSFLLSDKDEVPQSLKQFFKVAGCLEVQRCVSAISASVSHGISQSLSPSAKVGASIAEEEMKAIGEGVGNGLVDRLLNKLFSDAGKGFASVVVASATRSLVVSVMEQFNLLGNSANQSSNRDERADFLSFLMDFARSTKNRVLIMDCIQTFVATAVSVYLDRTKDVNMFDDMIAGIVKPEHQGPVTELLTSVCSSSIETLVRTSQEVLAFGGNNNNKHLVVIPNAFLNDGHQKRDEAAFMSGIDALSRVLAVPSNRKLIMEVAGTMTSEGVRSFIEVLIGRFTASFHGKKTKEEEPMKKEEREMAKRSVIGDKLQQVGDLTKAAVDKSVVAITMCFVICLHSVVGGVRLLQPCSS
ncbi:unnamed protein product [Sphagnum troendelagicum]|uniref:Protein PHLOEM PROTEIN 2-LIKE A10 n=1 Tax=Sphagnum troendelagicum TaxID=128251 RepID=A0ABP0U6P5_9BRYO